MKSKLLLVLSLAIGIVACWSVAMPVADGAGTLLGSYYVYSGEICCTNLINDNCNNGQVVGYLNCDDYEPFIIIDNLGPNPFMGSIVGDPVCSGDGGCGNLHNSQCNGNTQPF